MKKTTKSNLLPSLYFLISLFFFLTNIPLVFAQEYIVNIEQGATVFTPNNIIIHKGDTVQWINNDSTIPSHMFASIPGANTEDTPEIEIVTLTPGQTWKHTFKKKGRYPYFCFIHKGMIGEVTVTSKK